MLFRSLDVMILNKPILIFTPLDFVQKTNFSKNGCTEIKVFDQLKMLIQNLSESYIESIILKQKNCLQKEITNIKAAHEIATFIKRNQTHIRV